MKKRTILNLFFLIIFLSACGSQKTLDTHTPLAGYPGPQNAYPRPGIPTQNPNKLLPQLVPFHLDKPINTSNTQVSGTGPANIPIIIADITFNGEILGNGTIGQDGKFIIQLVMPVEANHRIGIALGDLTNTDWDSSDFLDKAFFGDEFRQVPTIGFFYDTYLVTE
jgi:hypothetical protein